MISSMKNLACTVLADNQANALFTAEHGLSLLLEYAGKRILFDTGAGTALLKNAGLLNLNFAELDGVVLSHGHYDHTGGLPFLPPLTVWHTPDISEKRYSLHPGKQPKELTIPAAAAESLKRNKCKLIRDFTEILPGFYLTGAIPRFSGEDCGGPFYFDREGKSPDPINDELALLLDNGTLIQGCCHAGIINTLEYCKERMPDIKIRNIIGGLHLLLASEERLKQTADYLKNSQVENLYLLHCTGSQAIDFLKSHLEKGKIILPETGKTFICS